MSRAQLHSIPSLPATNILFSMMPFDILTHPLPLALVLCRRKPSENRSDTKCVQKWPKIVSLILKQTKCVGKPCGRKFLRGLVWVSDLHGYMQGSCCCMVFDLPFLENSITHFELYQYYYACWYPERGNSIYERFIGGMAVLWLCQSDSWLAKIGLIHTQLLGVAVQP